MAAPRDVVVTDPEEGDDGAIFAFWAFFEARRGRPLDLENIAQLHQAIAEFEAAQ